VASAAFVANAFETKEYLLRKVPEVMGLVDPDDEEGHPDEKYPSELVTHLANIKSIFLRQQQEEEIEAGVLEDKWKELVSEKLDSLSLQHCFTVILSSSQNVIFLKN
jgi:hypothetical protein